MKCRRHLHTILITACCLVSLSASAAEQPGEAEDPNFPLPRGLVPAVDFWERVYLDATTKQGFLHDSKRLGVIYELIDVGDGSSRQRQRIIDKRRKHWKGVLRKLAKQPTSMSVAEGALLNAIESSLGREASPQDLLTMSNRIRFQLGQRDKFRAGVIRSGAYEVEMQATFQSLNLPQDLAYLPHVESSFNVHAYSKYGAAGLWQFMRGTGRRYMTVDYVVDERLDPKVATRGAAKLLRDNYQSLKSWPLAITAYNHGGAGMRRAVRRLGTKDMGEIAERYTSRTFGFASRNFYAQFLAARRIMRSHQTHFGTLHRDSPEVVDELELPFFAEVKDLENYLGVSSKTIQQYNPALRKPVFNASKLIPEGFVLRLPAGTLGADPDAWLTRVPSDKRFDEQHASSYYQVRRGDTLSQIARRHRTSISTLVALNGLSSRHRIYPGQVLQLPDRGGKRRAKTKSNPKPELASSKTTQVAKLEVPKPAAAASAAVEKRTAAAKPAPVQQPTLPAAAPVTPPTEPVQPPATSVPEPVPAETQPLTTSVEPAPSRSPSSGRVAPWTTPSEPVPEPSVVPELPADSPWRSVDGSKVSVDADETLGHFADWLEISAQRLRNLNGLRYGRPLQIGQRLKLDFSRVDADTFLQRRTEYHKAIEEDFLSGFEISGTTEHTVRRGDSIWELSHKKYRVPTWLIRRYNPDQNLTGLLPGTKLRIPVVEPRESS